MTPAPSRRPSRAGAAPRTSTVDMVPAREAPPCEPVLATIIVTNDGTTFHVSAAPSGRAVRLFVEELAGTSIRVELDLREAAALRRAVRLATRHAGTAGDDPR